MLGTGEKGIFDVDVGTLKQNSSLVWVSGLHESLCFPLFRGKTDKNP